MFLLYIIGKVATKRAEIERKLVEIKATPKSKFLCWRRQFHSFINVIIAVGLIILMLYEMFKTKEAYLRIDYKTDIRNEWAIFEISEKEFNALYPVLSKKSGKEIYFYE